MTDDDMPEGLSERARRVAARLLEARRGGAPLPAGWDDAQGLTRGETYAVQALVAREHGPAGGFKVACKPGAPQIMAPIFRDDIMASPAQLPVPEGERIGIELEIGFRVTAPLPAPDAPDRTARLAECLELVPVIEIVRTRLDTEDAPPLIKLADNQINGGLVVGLGLADWRHLELSGAHARLSLGGQTILDGRAEVPGGDAFANFQALEAMVGDHCGGLQPGHVVITGSLNGLPYVTAPSKVEGHIDGLGAVSLDLVVLA
jgi:2-keto-4-pentenoate hydratase